MWLWIIVGALLLSGLSILVTSEVCKDRQKKAQEREKQELEEALGERKGDGFRYVRKGFRAVSLSEPEQEAWLECWIPHIARCSYVVLAGYTKESDGSIREWFAERVDVPTVWRVDADQAIARLSYESECEIIETGKPQWRLCGFGKMEVPFSYGDFYTEPAWVTTDTLYVGMGNSIKVICTIDKKNGELGCQVVASNDIQDQAVNVVGSILREIAGESNLLLPANEAFARLGEALNCVKVTRMVEYNPQPVQAEVATA